MQSIDFTLTSRPPSNSPPSTPRFTFSLPRPKTPSPIRSLSISHTVADNLHPSLPPTPKSAREPSSPSQTSKPLPPHPIIVEILSEVDNTIASMGPNVVQYAKRNERAGAMRKPVVRMGSKPSGSSIVVQKEEAKKTFREHMREKKGRGEKGESFSVQWEEMGPRDFYFLAGEGEWKRKGMEWM